MNRDTDGDGLSDGNEVNLYATNPSVEDATVDSDGDGLMNVQEVDIHGTNPTEVDTDADGLGDKDELTIYETNPLEADTDGDSYLDGEEVSLEFDPNDPESNPMLSLPSENQTILPPTTLPQVSLTVTISKSSAFFIPSFTIFECFLAFSCLVVLDRQKSKCKLP